MPEAEVILWSKLRARQLVGCKFRRQYSVGPFVIDFYSPQYKLAIEVDGDSHFVDNAEEYDRQRQQYIEQFGIHFLRFTNADVRTNLYGVLDTIMQKIKELSQPPGPPAVPLKKGDEPPTVPLRNGDKGDAV